ncbi:MAG: hypothetical protein HC824_08895 [Synechococcales cyanobacterium RM1_1_8]|nr:hypothetical protein [Synechococcales cyanobacterium RM1_1_8]
MLFFANVKDDHASEPGLWATDGTPAGTRLLREIPLSRDRNGIPQDIFPRFVGVSAQRVWFMGDPFLSGELSDGFWSSDGTTLGTELVAKSTDNISQAFRQTQRLDIQPYALLNGNFVFSMVTPTETQLWQNGGAARSQRLGQFPYDPPQGGFIPGLLTSTGSQLSLPCAMPRAPPSFGAAMG